MEYCCWRFDKHIAFSEKATFSVDMKVLNCQKFLSNWKCTYLQQNLLIKGQVFYMYSSRRLVQLGSPHQSYIQQVLVLGSENLCLCNNIRCEYLLSVWLWNFFNGGSKLVWPKINKL